ncbi:hypothetical protein PoB_006937300 [Plakobranchus ocellatus]|uniref:Uncharacterized protein n=1 Tax=Plakobranchus ocellatus TaxID=259542 RepID=A0AAV4DF60_9GAST|nr:hypothetical protein PoB_006937300 [Plakobranchus ocellatus]
MIKSFSAVNSSIIVPRPSRRESPYTGECALKSPSTRKGFGSCSKSSARESFEQTVRVFSRLIVAAAACRPVFRSISKKQVPFLMRRAASPPVDPPCGRSRA